MMFVACGLHFSFVERNCYRKMSRIFVGNLPMDVKEREIDDLFYK